METSGNTFNQIIHGSTPVMVDFYADWCMPCRILSPILTNLAEDMGDEIRILKLDIEKNKEIVQKYKIYSVPTIYLFQNGEVIWKGSGARSKEELKRIIRSKTKLSEAS
jgi:thioredoxin 1